MGDMKDKEKKGKIAERLTEADKAEAILKKYDKESDKMEYTGFMAKFVAALAISFSAFQIYTAIFGVLDAQLQRAVHLGFGLALVYLLYPTRKSWSRHKLHPFDLLLAILGAAAPAYIIMEYQSLVLRAGLTSGEELVWGLMGTVSGSSVANVVGTGSLTIPMMKKCGFEDEYAAAVEA